MTERLRDTAQKRLDHLTARLGAETDPITREGLLIHIEGAQLVMAVVLQQESLYVRINELIDRISTLITFKEGVERQTTELAGMQKVLKFVRPAVQGLFLLMVGFGWAEYQSYTAWRESIEFWVRDHCSHHVYEEIQNGGKVAAECARFVQVKSKGAS